MLNLLPPELKQEYHYARRNTGLLRWLGIIGAGILGVAIITAAGTVYLHNAAHTYNAQTEVVKQSLQDQKQAAVEKQIQEISNNLKLAVQVLSKEVLFSKLLQQLAVVTPSNAILSNLTITQAQSSVDITAKTADYTSATQLNVNLTDPANQIFAKADIVSINCLAAPGSALASRYPCTVVIRALFATNNPFLFISNKAKQGGS